MEFSSQRKNCFVLGHQRGWHDVTCEPATETRLYSFTVRFVDVQNVGALINIPLAYMFSFCQ